MVRPGACPQQRTSHPCSKDLTPTDIPSSSKSPPLSGGARPSAASMRMRSSAFFTSWKPSTFWLSLSSKARGFHVSMLSNRGLAIRRLRVKPAIRGDRNRTPAARWGRAAYSVRLGRSDISVAWGWHLPAGGRSLLRAVGQAAACPIGTHSNRCSMPLLCAVPPLQSSANDTLPTCHRHHPHAAGSTCPGRPQACLWLCRTCGPPPATARQTLALPSLACSSHIAGWGWACSPGLSRMEQHLSP